jgi:hypothetical protein
MSEELKPFGWKEMEEWRESLPQYMARANEIVDMRDRILTKGMILAFQKTIAIAEAERKERIAATENLTDAWEREAATAAELDKTRAENKSA